MSPAKLTLAIMSLANCKSERLRGAPNKKIASWSFSACYNRSMGDFRFA